MIISHDSQKSVRHHSDTFFGGGSFEPSDVPWIKVGKLYMSVCITGENSWGPIAKDLSKGAKVFVFTGRHGEATGNPVTRPSYKDVLVNSSKAGKMVDKLVFDINHLKEDRKIVDGLKGAGFNVDLLDLYDANDKRTTQQLQALILEKLKQGNAVILAWCFSFFAMDEFDAAVAKTGTAQAIAEANFDKSVVAMVEANYSWVPKPW